MHVCRHRPLVPDPMDLEQINILSSRLTSDFVPSFGTRLLSPSEKKPQDQG